MEDGAAEEKKAKRQGEGRKGKDQFTVATPGLPLIHQFDKRKQGHDDGGQKEESPEGLLRHS